MRRVERLNARAGIYALSLLLWHGMKIVCIRMGSTASLPLTVPLKGRPTDLAPSGRGPVLRSLEHCAQGRAASGQDEDREAVRQDVLFRKLDLGLFARR